MTTLSVKDARQNFAEAIQSSNETPVFIKKNKQDVSVLLSVKRYKELEDMEDKVLSVLANKIDEKGDYCSAEETEEFIKYMINE